MHQNLTPHTWMHRNHHSSVKCTDILPLTHENTTIIIPELNAPETPSHMNAQKSSLLREMTRKPNTHRWMHRHRHSSGKCTGILPLTHECTKSSLLRKTHCNPTPHTWMHRHHHYSIKCTKILPLTHECTEIVTPQVNAPESYPSQTNAPKSSLLK